MSDPQAHAWKLLQTPSGLHSEYLMDVGQNYPFDNSHVQYYGLGNHSGPRGLAVEGGNLYVVSPGSECVRGGIKMTFEGELV